MKRDYQTITITLDIADNYANHCIAIQALLDIIRILEEQQIYPRLVGLELAPSKPTH
jgi:hypothetical protein